MNVGVILIALIMIFAASVGIVAMASSNAAAPVDTMGNTLDANSNQSHSTITNASATLAETGGGLGLGIVIVFIAGLLFAVLGLILYGGSLNMNPGRR